MMTMINRWLNSFGPDASHAETASAHRYNTDELRSI
jgi:hypothetical protein